MCVCVCVCVCVCDEAPCLPELLNHMSWPDLDLDDIKDLGLDWGDGEVLGDPLTPAPTLPNGHTLPRTMSPSNFINTNTCHVSDGNTSAQMLFHVHQAAVLLT